MRWILPTIAALLLPLLLSGCASDESVIPYSAIPAEGDPERGAELYVQAFGPAPACNSCHVEGAAAAPDLIGYGAVAGTRVEGEDAHEYTFYAIAEPGRYIVPDYGNAMYNRYDEMLEPQQIADLIAYLLTR